MCIRDRLGTDVRFEDFFTSKDAAGRRTFVVAPQQPIYGAVFLQDKFCLLYTSDAADERSSVDLGGRRIIKKKKLTNNIIIMMQHQ